MHKIYCLLAAVMMSMTAGAAQFTGVSLQITMEQTETLPLPPTGFPQNGEDLSDNQESVFIVNGFTATTTGAVASVAAKGALYKRGTTPEEWRTLPASKQADGVWALSNINVNLLDGLQPGEVYVFEIYFEGVENEGTSFYYNNGGYNYKVIFRVAKGESAANVSFLENQTAGVKLITNGETAWYYYDGDGSYHFDSNQLGEVNQLVLDGFLLRLNRKEGTNIDDVSVQYKVYEEGTSGSWNGIQYQDQRDIEGKLVKEYTADNVGCDLLQGLEAGKSYVLEMMWQVIDRNGKYYFFNKDSNSETGRFHFTVGKGMAKSPQFTAVTIHVTVNGEAMKHSIPANGMETVQLGQVSEFVLNRIAADVQANGQNVTEVFMDYQVAEENSSGTGWQSIHLNNVNESQWAANDLGFDVLQGLQEGTNYELWFNMVGRYGEYGDTFHQNNGNTMYRVAFTVGAAFFLRGDVNGDGEVGIADVTMLSSLVLAQSENPRSDVNNDGETGIADITALVTILIKQ